jgi:hypothetical protein
MNPAKKGDRTLRAKFVSSFPHGKQEIKRTQLNVGYAKNHASRSKYKGMAAQTTNTAPTMIDTKKPHPIFLSVKSFW